MSAVDADNVPKALENGSFPRVFGAQQDESVRFSASSCDYRQNMGLLCFPETKQRWKERKRIRLLLTAKTNKAGTAKWVEKSHGATS